MNKSAGLVYGDMAHHLDHIAPLCALLEIPLIVTDENLAILAQKYYPRLSLIYWDYLDVFFNLVEQFDIIFTCMPRPLFEDLFFLSQKILGKEISTIWVPHGNSDKGHFSTLMEGLNRDLYALVYGKKMIDFLKMKGSFDQLNACLAIGNFRYTYYLKNKAFYDSLLNQQLPSSFPLILYAPTWQDAENSTSFYEACSLLIENLPKEYNLVIKLHPNLNDLETDKIIIRYENTSGVFFLKNFPCIYPLLNKISLYIGDMSSIGYDFLTFNRPMIFLNQNRRVFSSGLFLHRAGISLTPEDYPHIYTFIKEILSQNTDVFSSFREKLYAYTFENKTVCD